MNRMDIFKLLFIILVLLLLDLLLLDLLFGC